MCTSMAAGLASERKFVFKRYMIIDANIYVRIHWTGVKGEWP